MVEALHAIGVDLGGTKILAGVVARDGSVVRRHERATPQDSQERVIAELEATVEELLDDSVGALGFGVPSPIDAKRGVAVRCPHIPLADAPLRDHMRERFGVPVGLDNDANAAAIGEWRAGAGRGIDDLVMLTLGTGVGGGVISAGAPFRGRNGDAVAAVSISGPDTRLTPDKLSGLLRLGMETCARISARLGYHGPAYARPLPPRTPGPRAMA